MPVSPTPFWHYSEVTECNSTQLLAIERIRKGGFKGPFALSCIEQTAGFGRRGDKWFDCGESFALSLAWKPALDQVAPDERWPSWISLWVWRGLIDFDGRLRPLIRLKWPNDLVVGSQKLGGVLVSQLVVNGETFRVAGIGLNLSWVAEKPVGIQVTDLQSLLAEAVDRKQVIDRILKAVANGLEGDEDTQTLDTSLDIIRTAR
jgi:biotin-(acetyl-CoA carboxylase) ligase